MPPSAPNGLEQKGARATTCLFQSTVKASYSIESCGAPTVKPTLGHRVHDRLALSSRPATLFDHGPVIPND